MNRGNFFSGYGCHGNHENDLFVVSVAAVAKGENSLAYFRNLIWTSIPWEFQPKATIVFFWKNVATSPIDPRY